MSEFRSIGVIPAPIPSFLPHQHETWEIVYYTYGKGVATIGDQPIPFQPGTIICMPPRIDHMENSENGYTNIFMHTNSYPAQEKIPVFTDAPDRPFFNVAMMLHKEFHLKQPNWKLVTQDLFDILMLYLNRWRSGERGHPLVEKLKTEIVENLPNAEFDVGKAIGELPVSSDHLRKVFSKATGRTPLEYLTHLRMDEAKHMLKVGGFSVKEVAMRVGFQDPYYFSRLFRKVTGSSPTDFVKAAR